jgi:beta-phosphoglucomutase-like phosphatase (HAD superfamily)
LVLEDAEAGIEAARAGGFVPVGIGPAAGSAVFRIDKLSDLLGIIK